MLNGPVHKGMKPFTRCMHNTNPLPIYLTFIYLAHIFGVFIFISDKWEYFSLWMLQKCIESSNQHLEYKGCLIMHTLTTIALSTFRCVDGVPPISLKLNHSNY